MLVTIVRIHAVPRLTDFIASLLEWMADAARNLKWNMGDRPHDGRFGTDSSRSRQLADQLKDGDRTRRLERANLPVFKDRPVVSTPLTDFRRCQFDSDVNPTNMAVAIRVPEEAGWRLQA
jgi:hypothetical protein